MSTHFDIICIGSGGGGRGVAFPAAKAGRSVAIIDERPFGGTCALRGCEPKKVFAEAAAHVGLLTDMDSHTRGGVQAAPRMDWARLQTFKRSFTDPVPGKVREAMDGAGITAIEGRGVFIDAHTVQVGDTTYTADMFVIATGSSPAPLPIEGAEHALSSDDFLELDAIGKTVVFIGGGYISFEFAHACARAGSEAIILHRSEDVLKEFDPELVEMLVMELEMAGVEVHTKSPVKRVEQTNDGFMVHAGGQAFACDMVVHGAGRVPNVADMGLEAAGVEFKAKGIVTDGRLKTSQPHIYAAGDCVADCPMLIPVAVEHTRTIVHNLLHTDDTTPPREKDLRGLASVVFTYPPLAKVGMTEEEALRAGRTFERRFDESQTWSEYRRIGTRMAGYKLLIDGDELLGAHFLGHGAEELANIAAVAMRNGIPVSALEQQIWAYPTFGYTYKYMW